MGYPHRMLSLFEPAGFIDNPGPQRFQMCGNYLADRLPHLLVIPGTVREQLLELLRINPQALGHRFDRFTFPGQQQPFDIKCRPLSPFTPAHRLGEGA